MTIETTEKELGIVIEFAIQRCATILLNEDFGSTKKAVELWSKICDTVTEKSNSITPIVKFIKAYENHKP